MGDCDAPEHCTGVTPACPANAYAGPDVVCRPAAGPCDVDETCSGTSTDCPADVLAGTDVVCREAAGACDVAEYCSGGVDCPGDVLMTDGAVCGPAATCSDLTCRSGARVEVPRSCAPGETCDPVNGCTPPRRSGCGCAVQGGDTNAPAWALAPCAGLAWRRRRKATA